MTQISQTKTTKAVELRDPQTYVIIGAATEIHQQLGHGFLEAVYQDAAVIEFPLQNIPSEREVALPIKYRNILLPTYYRADRKSTRLNSSHQLISYAVFCLK